MSRLTKLASAHFCDPISHHLRISHTISGLSDELARYENEILRLRTQLGETEANYAILKEHYGRVRSLFAPIRRIPSDVLCRYLKNAKDRRMIRILQNRGCACPRWQATWRAWLENRCLQCRNRPRLCWTRQPFETSTSTRLTCGELRSPSRRLAMSKPALDRGRNTPFYLLRLNGKRINENHMIRRRGPATVY
jgi:hypothetical protein